MRTLTKLALQKLSAIYHMSNGPLSQQTKSTALATFLESVDFTTALHALSTQLGVEGGGMDDEEQAFAAKVW